MNENRRIPFASAARYLLELPDYATEIDLGSPPSEQHSVEFDHPVYGRHLWSLNTEDDENIAFVWVDAQGRYHVDHDGGSEMLQVIADGYRLPPREMH